MFTILSLNNRHFWKWCYAMEWCEYYIGHSSRRVKKDEPNLFLQSLGIINFKVYIILYQHKWNSTLWGNELTYHGLGQAITDSSWGWHLMNRIKVSKVGWVWSSNKVNVVLNRTVVVDSDWRFDNLCSSHLQIESKWVFTKTRIAEITLLSTI